ncbi:MAG: haloacid dehalogenase-like hydrolase [Deltaproteobacteria bacterium]|nr:haloacid dehalogenase-like hydrolase [Deltaproteobacteria bacterium]
MKETVAVIFDFDDTLAPDTTSGFLEQWGEKPDDFWNDKVNILLEQGWDPIPAYLYRLIEASKNRPAGERITKQLLAAFGSRVRFHHGVSRIFGKLKQTAEDVHPGLRLEFYIISSGIREIILNTRISSQFKQIWACDFHYSGSNREILFPKNVISFTDKTRYLFQISKGFVGPEYENRPFEVNRRVDEQNIRIPFEQMIYVGDGYTDIPCFSLIRKQQGIAIGVFDPERKEKWRQAWGFIEENRVSNLVPADYSKGSALEQSLLMAVDSMARRVALRGRTYQG